MRYFNALSKISLYAIAINSCVFATSTKDISTDSDKDQKELSIFINSMDNLPQDIKSHVFQYIEMREFSHVITCYCNSIASNIDKVTKQFNADSIDDKNHEYSNLLNNLIVIDYFTRETFWKEKEVGYEELKTLKELETRIKNTLAEFHSSWKDEKKSSEIYMYLDKFITMKDLFPIQSFRDHRCFSDEPCKEIISKLPLSLKILDISESEPYDETLRGVSRFKQLESLNLYDAGMFLKWEGVIKTFPKTLKELNLIKADVSFKDLCDVGQLKQLESLKLAYLNLNSGEKWQEIIKNLPKKLKELDLKYTDIPDDVLCTLSHLEELERLRLSNITFENSEKWENIIKTLPKTLKELHLRNTNITAESMLALSCLEQLEYLNLTNLDFDNTEEWENIIETLPNTLKKIKLTFTDITAENLLQLNRFEQLESLNLANLGFDSIEDGEKVIKSLPKNLKELNLKYTELYIEEIRHLRHLEQLEHLNLSYLELDNTDEWEEAIKSLPVNLKKLNLSGTNISTKGMQDLSSFKQLEDLNLFQISDIDHPEEWVNIIKNLPTSLKKLDISHSNFTKESLFTLKHLEKLEYLNLGIVENFGNINELKSKITSLLPKLKYIDAC